MRAHASGSVCQSLRICGPVKRSNTLEPVSRATASGPPRAFVISAHCGAVLASIHTGATSSAKVPGSWAVSGRRGSRSANTASASARR